jgi:glycosyltransferase involved in cell wall biosynthesis
MRRPIPEERQPLRIARCHIAVSPYPGGVQRHIELLSQAQVQRGALVSLGFNVGKPVNISDMQVFRGVSLVPLRPQALRDFLFYVALSLKCMVQGRRFDVVHVHGDWSAFLFGRFFGRAVSAKVRVASVHGEVRTGKFWNRAYRFSSAGYQVRYATGRREVSALSKACASEWEWIPSAPHPAIVRAGATELPPAHRTIDVLTVASLVPVKNLQLVIDIARILPEHRFSIVGSGPLHKELGEYALANAVRNVEFVGSVTPDRLADIYMQARLFLLTSRSEGTPTAMIEAMTVGLPIVTSASNDYRGLVDSGENGYVVATPRADEFAARIRELLSDSAAQRRFGVESRRRAAAYSWSGTERRIGDLVDAVFRASRHRNESAL